jgi:hypothetical protein
VVVRIVIAQCPFQRLVEGITPNRSVRLLPRPSHW